MRLKIDPGSKTTGLAIVNDDTREVRYRYTGRGDVVFAAELEHRGQQIKKLMDSRRAIRRSRRNRKTRYRQPRFNNRRRKEGWLPPSLRSRVENIETWIRQLGKKEVIMRARKNGLWIEVGMIPEIYVRIKELIEEKGYYHIKETPAAWKLACAARRRRDKVSKE